MNKLASLKPSKQEALNQLQFIEFIEVILYLSDLIVIYCYYLDTIEQNLLVKLLFIVKLHKVCSGT